MSSRPLLVPLCVIVGANTFSIGGFPALLPEMSTVAGLADWELGILTGVFGFARMIADLPAGLFIQRRLRAALLLAPLGIVAGVLCLGAGGPFWVLVLGRGLMAIGHTLGMLGGVLLVGSLPSTLPWNVALILTCAPQIIGVAVLPSRCGRCPEMAPRSPSPAATP